MHCAAIHHICLHSKWSHSIHCHHILHMTNILVRSVRAFSKIYPNSIHTHIRINCQWFTNNVGWDGAWMCLLAPFLANNDIFHSAFTVALIEQKYLHSTSEHIVSLLHSEAQHSIARRWIPFHGSIASIQICIFLEKKKKCANIQRVVSAAVKRCPEWKLMCFMFEFEFHQADFRLETIRTSWTCFERFQKKLGRPDVLPIAQTQKSTQINYFHPGPAEANT